MEHIYHVVVLNGENKSLVEFRNYNEFKSYCQDKLNIDFNKFFLYYKDKEGDNQIVSSQFDFDNFIYFLNNRNEKEYIQMFIKEKIGILNNNNNDYNNSDNNDNDRWNILYQILSCIERLFNNYISSPNSSFKINKNNSLNITTLFDNIIQSITHPHTFIKVIALRLILNIILPSEEYYSLNESQLNIILSQISFILVSNPDKLFFEEKAFNYCKNIIKTIITKKEFKIN
jgi:hypothetical protein